RRYFIRSKVFSGASVGGYQLFVFWKRKKSAAVPWVMGRSYGVLSSTARRRNEEKSKRRFLILAGNAVRGEPLAHRGVFGRRGRAPFGEFLALFRQQFH